ncbi:Protein phosphatase 2C homolog 3 (PP2C-3) [Durusdinium trenchii]|uniref:Protein phosphatase 2C homolog 3 (PP2C-3) n=1 Tax=Durusdinium trenchii TaxID=1381693 RepID=A0ABP0L9K0_9DINO
MADGTLQPAVFPEIVGDAPFREVPLRHEEEDYVLWLGKEASSGLLSGVLKRILRLPDLMLEESDALRLEGGLAPAVRSSRCRFDHETACSRPPLEELLQLTTAGASSQHAHGGLCTAYGPRVSNQDSYICCAEWGSIAKSPASLFAVCDGHGGGVVSENLPAMLSRELAALGELEEGRLVEAVEAIFVEVDEQLHKSLDAAAERCGSTCALCLSWPVGGAYRILLANLGDSRALLYRARGDWEHLTETCDHKPDVVKEKKRIRAAGGYVLPSDEDNPARLDAVLATSRAFGNFRFKDVSHSPGTRKVSPVPDVTVLDARAGDVIVLATDGVLDVLSSSQVANFAVRGLAAGAVEAAADVVWEALQAQTQDNVTCAVIRLGS